MTTPGNILVIQKQNTHFINELKPTTLVLYSTRTLAVDFNDF